MIDKMVAFPARVESLLTVLKLTVLRTTNLLVYLFVLKWRISSFRKLIQNLSK